MAKNSALVLFGVMIGAVLVRGFYLPAESPSNSLEGQTISAPDAEESQSSAEQAALPGRTVRSSEQDSELPDIELGSGITERVSEMVIRGTTDEPDEQSVGLGATEANVAIGSPLLPEVYRDLVGPPSSRVLRTDELFARFAEEPRDEAWAYPMELGMNQHIAASVNLVGTAIESVECRATACVIAGYVQPGFENASRNLIREMAQSGWWQLSNSTISTRADRDGVARFVTIIPRTDDDMMEFAPQDSGERPVDSTTQSATRQNARA